MINGTFEIEDQDITRLDVGTFGWVNLGAHSVRLGTDDSGNLTVEFHPRGNEGTMATAPTVNVPDELARELGGINPDAPEACLGRATGLPAVGILAGRYDSAGRKPDGFKPDSNIGCSNKCEEAE